MQNVGIVLNYALVIWAKQSTSRSLLTGFGAVFSVSARHWSVIRMIVDLFSCQILRHMSRRRLLSVLWSLDHFGLQKSYEATVFWWFFCTKFRSFGRSLAAFFFFTFSTFSSLVVAGRPERGQSSSTVCNDF